MGLEINRANAVQQLTDMNLTLQNSAEGVRDAKTNIEIFISNLSLQGETYDGFRSQYENLHYPVLKGMLCYIDEMLAANKSYSDKMAYLKGDYLHEDALQSQIAKAQTLVSCAEFLQTVQPLLVSLARKLEGSLQEKLDSLYTFASASKDIYSPAATMLNYVKKGIAFIEATTCNPTDGTFTYPSGSDYDMNWAICLNAFWNDKQTFGMKALVFIDDEADKLFAELVSANDPLSVSAKGKDDLYNWPAIEELLKKDPKDMKIWEYLALSRVLQSMTSIDKDGKAVTDTEALAKFITLGYDRSIEYDEMYGKRTVEYHYRIRPVFANLCIVYKEGVDGLVEQSGQLLFNASAGGEQRTAKDYLLQEIAKSAILEQIVTRGNHIVQPQAQFLKEITSPSDSNPDPSKMIPLKIDIDQDDSSCTVHFNGFLSGLFENEITVEMFNDNPRLSIQDIQRKQIDSLYRDKKNEFYNALGNEVGFTILSKALSKWPLAEYLVQAGRLGAETYYRNKEIDLYNLKLDQLKGNFDLTDVLESFAVGGVVTTVDTDLRLSNCYVNESELLLRLLGYNYARREADPNHQDITLEQFMEQLDPSNAKAQINPDSRSALVEDYIDWYKDDVHGLPGNNDPYRDKLFDVYKRFLTEHPEFDGENLNKLTPNQINELAKKERDPSYELNLGGTP